MSQFDLEPHEMEGQVVAAVIVALLLLVGSCILMSIAVGPVLEKLYAPTLVSPQRTTEE